MWKRKTLGLTLAAMLAGSQFAYAAEEKTGNAGTQVTAGYQYSLQVEEDGTVWSFGSPVRNRYSSSPQIGRLPGGSLQHIVQVSAGFAHSAAVDDEGRVWAWGDNEKGQLGQWNTVPYDAAVSVILGDGEPVKAVAVAAGYDHTLALTGKGKVWAWGSNRYGELGDGTELDRGKPVQVMNGERPLDDIVAVSAGFGTSLALNREGEVWTWGSQGKADGAIGKVMTSKGNERVPLKNIVAIAAGYDHSLALDKSGKLYVWGVNRYGQLGLGSKTPYSMVATMLPGVPAFKAIAAGDQASAAVDEKGDIWVWGVGISGTDTNLSGESIRFVPERITDGGHFTSVSVGRIHGLAVDDEKRIWIWGKNENGRLGQGYEGYTTSKPIHKNPLKRTYASPSSSSVTVEEAISDKQELILRLNLQLKDYEGKSLSDKWPTAEIRLPGRDPIVAPLLWGAHRKEGYQTELRIPSPYYLVPQKIEIRVDGAIVAEVMSGK
ncbi:RCC1 domain-containing protein [Paenibacillus ginsengarvi]|uniref:RCC1-like domain-containing protein n=1 Tax=Paenibacillus ginsengarvi TaxID=400777 RepID=A0A3B0BXR2_9BACL|nr:hypothetical protein [Paenibacillus ginsengarvi]RKN77114.1 hypothetical protein D7M11_24140 [Paenibacillus ginsengarvi]